MMNTLTKLIRKCNQLDIVSLFVSLCEGTESANQIAFLTNVRISAN